MKSLLRVLSFVAVAAMCSSFCHSAFATDTPAETHKGKVSFLQSVTPSEDKSVAPDFSWVDEKGATVHLKDLRGHAVFINFWGTWCRPCRMELPDIVTLFKQYDGEAKFIGIAMERPGTDPIPALTSFTKENGLPYQMVVGNEEIANAYGGLNGIPTTVIIDKNGKIVDKLVGMRNLKAFEDVLKKAL